MEIHKEQVRFYLNELFRLEEGYIEFRPIRGSEVKTKFFKNPCNPAQPIKFINNLQGKWNIYVGVNLRSSRRSKERFLKSVGTFFVDIDSKDFENGREEAREIIDNFVLTPSLIINSGSGYHCYWILEESFSIEHRGDIMEAKQVSAKLHNELYADATHDLGRILRLPGSMNVKDPDNPKLCSVDSFSFNTYDFRQLQDVLPDGEIDLNQGTDLDLSTESDIDTLKALTDRIPQFIIDYAKERPKRFSDDRSRHEFSVSCKLLEHGLNDKEVKDAFKVMADHDFDCSAKYIEAGERYLNRTISSAKAEYNKKQEAVNNIDSIEITD